MSDLADMICLDETQLEEQMKNVAEPILSKARQSGYLALQTGELYYELYSQKDVKAVIVICHGFSESERKYDEFIYYLMKAGFQVAVYDQRGHGKSLREGTNDNVVHINHFKDYVEDLHLFVEKIVKPFADGKSLYLYGHSMGGCVGALYLQEYLGDFQKAVLNAPMLRLQMGLCPLFIAKAICDVKILLGKGSDKLFFQGDFDPLEPFANSCATSEARHNYYHGIRRENACYQSSSASYSWGSQSILAGRQVMRKRNIKKINIPVMVFLAGKDNQVKENALHKFVKELPNGKMIRCAETNHEIYRSQNIELNKYLTQVVEFFNYTHNS